MATLTPDTALPELRRMLAAAGFDDARPDLGVLWPVVREWAALDVEGQDPEQDADMLLFECSLDLGPAGKYSPGPRFTVAFTRQFGFEDEDGEYAGMAHAHVELTYEPHEDFREITRIAEWSSAFGTADQFWGGGGPYAAAWADRVEATASYGTALRHQPRSVSMHYGPV